MVVRTFIHRWVLPLREQAHLLWLHQGIIDPMMEPPYPILETLLWVLMLKAISTNYLGLSVGPPSSTSILLL